MAQTREGAIIVAAQRTGVTVEFYLEQLATGLKWCWRCRVWRGANTFRHDRSRWDGLNAACQVCSKQPKQQRLVLEDANAYCRRRYATDPAFRHRVIERSRSRKRKIAPLPYEAIEVLLELTDGLCLYCDNPAESWDHMVPVSKGGETVPGNVFPCCLSCNSRKRDNHVYDFIDRYGIAITDRLMEALASALSWGQLTDEDHGR